MNSASKADNEEAVTAARQSPGMSALSIFPGVDRYSLTGVPAWSLREAGSAGAGSCSKAEVGLPWESLCPAQMALAWPQFPMSAGQ